MGVREYCALFSLALIWGASYLFIKVAVVEVPPVALVEGRLACSVLTLALVAVAQPKFFMGWHRFWRRSLAVGFVNNALPFVLIAWGEIYISSGLASILNATTPLFTVLLASWWSGQGREPLTLQRGLGALFGFSGVGIIVGPAALDFTAGGRMGIFGEIAVLLAAASYGVSALLSRGFKNAPFLVAPLSSQFAALIITLPVMSFWNLPTHVPSFKAIGAIVILGVVGTAIAYLLYFWLIQHVGSVRTSLVTYLLPATALIWGVLLLGEHISWNALVGLFLVLSGIMIINGTMDAWMRGLWKLVSRPDSAFSRKQSR